MALGRDARIWLVPSPVAKKRLEVLGLKLRLRAVNFTRTRNRAVVLG